MVSCAVNFFPDARAKFAGQVVNMQRVVPRGAQDSRFLNVNEGFSPSGMGRVWEIFRCFQDDCRAGKRGTAPCCRKLFVPSAHGGVAQNPRGKDALPWTMLTLAVIRAPLFSPASITTVPRESPEMIRLRGGKFTPSGCVPGG